MKPVIFIDYDSCLNDLNEAWCGYINKKYNANISSKDILHWNWCEDTFGKDSSDFWKDGCNYYFDDIMPREGAIDFINSIRNDYEIVILTSSWPGTESVKNEHIQRHFGLYNVIHDSNKYLYSGEGILIDDRPQTILNHIAYNDEVGIIFDCYGGYGWSKLTEENVDPFELNELDYGRYKRNLKIANTFSGVEYFIRSKYARNR